MALISADLKYNISRLTYSTTLKDEEKLKATHKEHEVEPADGKKMTR